MHYIIVKFDQILKFDEFTNFDFTYFIINIIILKFKYLIKKINKIINTII